MKSWQGSIGLLVLLLPAMSFADDVHYQDFIVGDQAVGLGGAYTAIAADPSGLWYNPAGIVDVRNTSLSLSANLYGIQDASVGKKDTIIPEDPISKLSVVPSSAGFVQALGRTDMNGKRPFAFGVSFTVPSYRKFSSSEEGTSQDAVIGTYRHGYHRAFEDQTLWVSIGGAMRLHGRLSIGAGLVLIHRSLQDAASSFVAADFDGTEYLRYRSAMMDLKLKLSERLFFGAMVRSPSITVYSSGQMRFSRSESDGAGTSGFLPTPEEVSVKSQSQIWGEGRAGIAYVIPELLILSADVSVHLPTSYTLVEVDNQRARDALLIAPEVNRNLVINGNLGAEVQFLKRFTVGAGAFSNFSSAKTIGDPTRPAPARVHMVGGTVAVGIFSEHTITRIGMTYARGDGSDVIPVNSPDQLSLDAQQFVKVDLTQSYAYFFLASTFRY
jgi:hypothetical protein